MKLISLKSDYAFKELFSYGNVRKQFLSDVLSIPLGEIKEVRMISPFLWKRWARQKPGILDMALELNGTDPVDDWSRLFNAESEEDLKMINAKNAGIREAVTALRNMSLKKNLRYLYEARLKMIRDRRAEDEYVRDEGIGIGIGKGMAQMTVSLVRKKAAKNMSVSEIADLLEEDESVIRQIYGLLKEHPDWGDKRICDELKG